MAIGGCRLAIDGCRLQIVDRRIGHWGLGLRPVAMTYKLSAITAVLALSTSVHAQSDNGLRSKARAKGGEGTNYLHLHASSSPMSELSRSAQVIVHGRVTDVRAHLLADESFVVTDTAIAPIRLFKQAVPVTSRAQPGVTKAITVRHLGGTLVDGGLKMTTEVNLFPAAEQFVPGDEVICFLRYDESERVFELVEGPFGAFRVRQGLVHPLTRQAAQASGSERPTPLAKFLADIGQQARTVK